MKKKIYTVALALLSLSGFTGCSESFLDLSNPSALSPSAFPSKMADMETLVNAVYALVNRYELYGAELLIKGPFITDHTCDMAWTADDHWNQLARNDIQSSNGMIQNIWYGYYAVIGGCNTLLEEVEKFEARGNLQAEEQTRLSQMRGEGLFWRGWAHQQLVQFWGEGYPCNGDGDKQGVPLRLSVVTAENMNAARNTVNEVYAQVLKDYEEAATLLPSSWDGESNRSRVTSHAVKSYMGQANLFMGNYDKAKQYLKEVIDESGKSLLPFNEYKDMFNDKQVKFNNESILELNFKASSGASSQGNTWSGGECTSISKFIAFCYLNAEGISVAGAWSNVFFHDANIERFGSDPRLAVCALAPGTPVIANGVNTVIGKYIDTEDNIKGWSLGKYNPVSFTPTEVSYKVGINAYLMRLAEVYLMYAEASFSSGDETTAREYLNKVRRRAYQGDTSHDITASGTQLRDAIREERFLELFGEGVQHWIDVCRWKTLDQEIAKWYKTTRVGDPHYDAWDLYYPIPKKELEDNPEIKQSTGY